MVQPDRCTVEVTINPVVLDMSSFNITLPKTRAYRLTWYALSRSYASLVFVEGASISVSRPGTDENLNCARQGESLYPPQPIVTKR